MAILFAHECLRVFADRLITEDDLNQFYKYLNATTTAYFKLPLNTANFHDRPLLFCNFLKSDDRLYQQLNDWRQCCPLFLDYQMRYNLHVKSTLKMVFFKEAVEHVIRICRVLQQPGGHLLLIGLDGTGRRTCLELASFISGHVLFQLNLKRAYAHQDFRDDMKLVFRQVAVQNRQVVLFIQEKDLLAVRLPLCLVIFKMIFISRHVLGKFC